MSQFSPCTSWPLGLPVQTFQDLERPFQAAARPAKKIRVTKTVFQFTAYKRPQIVPLLCVESNRNEHVNFYYCTSPGLSWEWLGSRPGQCTYYATLRRSERGLVERANARDNMCNAPKALQNWNWSFTGSCLENGLLLLLLLLQSHICKLVCVFRLLSGYFVPLWACFALKVCSNMGTDLFGALVPFGWFLV